MEKKFYISDLHLSHFNAIKFDNRPWTNIEEMNSGIIKEWNSRVSEKDSVYILGDISWGTPEETKKLISQLNGKKYWIFGNHDYKLSKDVGLQKEFIEGFNGYHEITDGLKRVILSHYPIFMFNGIRKGSVHLYGHVHNNEIDCELIKKWKAEYEEKLGQKIPMYNVGLMVDYMNWGPRTLDEILGAE